MDRIRALVIDEHIEVRKALTSRLSNCDDLLVLPAASSLQQGLDLATEHSPDVVLLGLPVVHQGRDLAGIGQLAATLAGSGAALLVLTTYADEDDRKTILLAGARRYLLKDIDTGHLLEEIRRALTESAAYARRPRAGHNPKSGHLPREG
ncbi:MAG TPA: response regulator transcription factor [Anaerolineales bacterium]